MSCCQKLVHPETFLHMFPTKNEYRQKKCFHWLLSTKEIEQRLVCNSKPESTVETLRLVDPQYGIWDDVLCAHLCTAPSNFQWQLPCDRSAISSASAGTSPNGSHLRKSSREHFAGATRQPAERHPCLVDFTGRSTARSVAKRLRPMGCSSSDTPDEHSRVLPAAIR